MAKLELSEETKTGMEAVGAADLLIAVGVQVDAEQLRAAATQSVLAMEASDHTSGLRTVVAFPGVSNVETLDKGEIERDPAVAGTNLRFLPYSLPSGTSSRIPWLAPASTYQAFFGMARELGVSACAVIGYRSRGARDKFSGADAGAGAGEALRACHAALCVGKVRRPAQLEHPGSAHSRTLWQAGALSFGAGLLHFGQNASRA